MNLTATVRELFRVYCHQLPARTLQFGEMPAPLCARCLGLYLAFALVGVWLLLHLGLSRRPAISHRVLSIALIGFVLCVIDGLFGLTYAIGLGNESRLLLGYLAGLAIGGLFTKWIAWRFPEYRGERFTDKSPGVFFLVSGLILIVVLGPDSEFLLPIIEAASVLGLLLWHLIVLFFVFWLIHRLWTAHRWLT